MQIRFEWDAGKAKANTTKHGVTFEEARTAFYNPLARIFDDEKHSTGNETREIIVGHSVSDRILLVSFAERQGSVRIISARRATVQERKAYEENVTRMR